MRNFQFVLKEEKHWKLVSVMWQQFAIQLKSVSFFSDSIADLLKRNMQRDIR